MLLWISLSGCTFVTDEDWAARLEGCEMEGQYVDRDGDGWGVDQATTCDELEISVNRTGDCDDSASNVYPGATETLYDGIDEDCLGDSDWDKDGDGHDAMAGGGDDCYDSDDDEIPSMEGDCDVAQDTLSAEDIYPGALDVPYDGVDADCSGGTDFDGDGDGFASCLECDDSDPARFPNDTAETWYDGFDDNCDGNDGDQDGDGYVIENYAFEPASFQLRGDCWDEPDDRPEEFSAGNDFPDPDAADVHPTAEEVWYDLVDSDCASDDDLDQDVDGDRIDSYSDRDGSIGTDCNDLNPAINAEAMETWYDGVDSDCSGGSDYDRDADGDNSDAYGGGDCDDGDARASSFAEEDCSSVGDDDCDGAANEEGAVDCVVLFADADHDGYGAGSSRCLCAAEGDYSSPEGSDCDDGNSSASPAGSETCATAFDDDCDGDAAEIGLSGCTTWYADSDGDGFGGTDTVCACTATSVYTASLPTDCNDGDASITADTTWYADADGDGYGLTASPLLACTQLPGFAAESSDCDDGNAAISPGATETCASAGDDNCDGLADPENAVDCTAFWADEDGDGYTGTGACLCAATAEYYASSDGYDCDESNAAINPGAFEVCLDGEDSDCDGSAGSCAITGAGNLGDQPLAFDGAASESLGNIVVGAGDISGDSLAEFMASSPGNGAGAVYAWADVASDSLSPSATLWGETSGDAFGASMAGLGDINGDGYGDYAVGAAGSYGGYGEADLFYGPLGASAPSGAATRLFGEGSGDLAGSAIAAIGDPDGDSVGGFAVGSPGNAYNGSAAGLVTVVDGASSWGSIALSSAADAVFYGDAAGDGAGFAFAVSSDANGDGVTDIAVGAPGKDSSGTDSGAAYLIFGPFSGVDSVANADLAIIGGSGDRRVGESLALGDFDGDGYDEMVCSSPHDDGTAVNAGSVWGITSVLPGTFAVGAAFFSIAGDSADQRFGASLAVGRVDSDGADDLIVGAPGTDSGTGAAFIFLGTLSGSFTASASNARFNGEIVGDGAGSAVAWLGDADGDGFSELGVGASAAGSGAGVAYRVRGGGF